MKKSIYIILLIAFGKLSAQRYYDDAQVRAYLNLEKKLGKDFWIHLDQQYRFTDNVTQFNRGSAELGLTYRISKHVKVQANYTFIQKYKKAGYFSTRHWYSAAVILKKDIDRWRFLYKNTFQVRSGDMNSEDAQLYKLYDRNKVVVKYEATKRFTFYAAEEVYVPLNSPQAKGIDRSRTFLGTEIVTCKNQSLELFFMYQVRLQPNEWFDQKKSYSNKPLKRDFIYGISYNISF